LLTEIGENVVVILSTHIVQDVQELCRNMAIIHHGKLLFAGAPNDALKSIDGRVWEKSITKDELAAHSAAHHIISNKLVAGRPVIHVLADVTPGDGFQQAAPTLEDVFFSTISAATPAHA
ncbi:MAG: ABC transporter ATP-binding protein, partial [Flavobacteriales bacterium]|nr:ABC transporter ATP-binding protein [Flavobacteriales bacterium]